MNAPLRVVMSSLELAKVSERPPCRLFDVGSDDGRQSLVSYNPVTDALYCGRHGDVDNCQCTSRVRLCGVLTDSITRDVLTRFPKVTNANS